MGLILSILIGLVAGYLGSIIFKGSGNGLLMNLLVGLVGGLIGGWVFGLLGIGGGNIIWQLISATLGAIILLWIISLIKKK
jgi:uncharacterized membrane protein YeaQ/YmgE (transglycosylase-associated protein family)